MAALLEGCREGASLTDWVACSTDFGWRWFEFIQYRGVLLLVWSVRSQFGEERGCHCNTPSFYIICFAWL